MAVRPKRKEDGGMLFFNVEDGYSDAVLRGYFGALLSGTDYSNLVQCESLEDMRIHLAQTDFGDFLQNEPSPLSTTAIADRCAEKMVKEFRYLRSTATEPLATFLDYITYGYMIDNVVLLILGTLKERDTQELLEKTHPLGRFDTLATLCVATTPAELYGSVLVDTPLAPYFEECLDVADLDEMHIEIIRNKLYRSYLEDFHAYCKRLGGVTAEVMCEILEFEADRRAITITINSFGTELTRMDRSELFPRFGSLYPEGTARLCKCDDYDQVRGAVEKYGVYKKIFDEVARNPESSIDDAFFKHEVTLCRLSFMRQFHYGCYYALVRLKEQEIRNMLWIAECISQDRKDRVQQNFINIIDK